jgi:hypothetical protein
VDLGRGLPIGDLGPRRLGDRGPHYWFHDLAQPALSGPGGYDRARPRAPRRPNPRLHHSGVQDVWRRDQLYAMVNRMRVLGMRKTTGCADVVMRSIIDTYFGPNRTVADLRELVRTGQGIDPLKDFSGAAREELNASALL